MTSPPEPIIVECPACGHCYEDWYRPSINRWIDNFSDEFIEEAPASTCPRCNCRAALRVWISDSTEQITIRVPQARFKRRDDPPLYWTTLYWTTIDHIAPSHQVSVMKVIRSVTDLDLNEVKDLIDNFPQMIVEERDSEKAKSIKKMLENAGARVTGRAKTSRCGRQSWLGCS